MPLAGRCGAKTMGFGDWLIPALTLARCAALHKPIHRFKTCFHPLLEVGITDTTPMVVIIEMNGHSLGGSQFSNECTLPCVTL